MAKISGDCFNTVSVKFKGGIIEKESAIHISNVMPFCEKCEKGVRLNRKRISAGDKEIYVRCCADCGEMFDKV